MPSSSSAEALSDALACPTCLEPFCDPCTVTPCGHSFCCHCLCKWLDGPTEGEGGGSTRCPMCMAPAESAVLSYSLRAAAEASHASEIAAGRRARGELEKRAHFFRRLPASTPVLPEEILEAWPRDHPIMWRLLLLATGALAGLMVYGSYWVLLGEADGGAGSAEGPMLEGGGDLLVGNGLDGADGADGGGGGGGSGAPAGAASAYALRHSVYTLAAPSAPVGLALGFGFLGLLCYELGGLAPAGLQRLQRGVGGLVPERVRQAWADAGRFGRFLIIWLVLFLLFFAAIVTRLGDALEVVEEAERDGFIVDLLSEWARSLPKMVGLIFVSVFAMTFIVLCAFQAVNLRFHANLNGREVNMNIGGQG